MNSLSPGRNLPGEVSDIIEGSALFQSVENSTAPAPSFPTDKWLLSLRSSHRHCSGKGKEGSGTQGRTCQFPSHLETVFPPSAYFCGDHIPQSL